MLCLTMLHLTCLRPCSDACDLIPVQYSWRITSWIGVDMLQTLHRPLLDEVSLPEVTRCGLNSPSPDSLTPERAAAMIWTWADGHPYNPYVDLSQPAQLWTMLQDVLRSSFGGADTKVQAQPTALLALHAAARQPACQAASGCNFAL